MLRYVAVFACSIAFIVPVKLGLAQARQLFVWPNATKLNAVLAPLIDGNSGRILHEAPSVSEYAIPQAGDEWWRWSSTQSVELPNRHSISVNVGESGSAQVYGYYIAKSYFSVVVLDFMSTVGLDRDIVSDLARNHAYHIAAEVPYGSGNDSSTGHQRSQREYCRTAGGSAGRGKGFVCLACAAIPHSLDLNKRDMHHNRASPL